MILIDLNENEIYKRKQETILNYLSYLIEISHKRLLIIKMNLK